jgi:hypothetical protein
MENADSKAVRRMVMPIMGRTASQQYPAQWYSLSAFQKSTGNSILGMRE